MALSKETFVICEGGEDAAFLTELARVRQMPDFEVSVIGAHETGGGIDGLLHHLNHIAGLRDFKRLVKDIVILADSEEDEAQTFKTICNRIANANNSADVDGFYVVPKKPFFRAKRGSLSCKVILQPGGNEPGCLETVLIRFLRRQFPKEMECVDDMVNCAGIKEPVAKWTVSKIDKAILRAAIGVINKSNPACSVSKLWERQPDLIPLGEDEFTPIWRHLCAVWAE